MNIGFFAAGTNLVGGAYVDAHHPLLHDVRVHLLHVHPPLPGQYRGPVPDQAHVRSARSTAVWSTTPTSTSSWARTTSSTRKHQSGFEIRRPHGRRICCMPRGSEIPASSLQAGYAYRVTRTQPSRWPGHLRVFCCFSNKIRKPRAPTRGFLYDLKAATIVRLTEIERPAGYVRSSRGSLASSPRVPRRRRRRRLALRGREVRRPERACPPGPAFPRGGW